jgi:hypothetical protein
MKMYVGYTLYFNERKAQYELEKAQYEITDLKQMMEDLKLDRKRQEIQREEDKERMNRQENYIRSLGVSLEDIKDQNNEIKQQNKEIKNQNKEIKCRLSIAVEDRAPLPEQSSKQERFVLLKRNDPEHPAYYTIRAQNAYTSNRIRAQQILFPRIEILLDFKCNPNSKSLYVIVKENLKKRGVLFDGNNIDLGETVNEVELVEEMNQINDVKYDVLNE